MFKLFLSYVTFYLALYCFQIEHNCLDVNVHRCVKRCYDCTRSLKSSIGTSGGEVGSDNVFSHQPISQ